MQESPCWPGPWIKNIITHLDAAAADRPLKAVGHHRADQRRRFGGKGFAHFGAQNVGRQVEVVGEAAEQMGRLVALGAAAVVSALAAEALIVAPAVGAAAAAERAFENDPVAFFDMVNRRGVLAELFDPAENFMAENDRVVDLEFAVQIFDIGAADAAHFNFDQSAVGGNVRNRILAQFEFIGTEQCRAS